MSRIDFTDNLVKYIGTIWYVDGTNGNDANSGKTPDSADGFLEPA